MCLRGRVVLLLFVGETGDEKKAILICHSIPYSMNKGVLSLTLISRH